MNKLDTQVSGANIYVSKAICNIQKLHWKELHKNSEFGLLLIFFFKCNIHCKKKKKKKKKEKKNTFKKKGNSLQIQRAATA